VRAFGLFLKDLADRMEGAQVCVYVAHILPHIQS
jgi:hypothetical protein